jgi:hypothetical protein
MLQNSVNTNKLMSKTPKNRNYRINTAATTTFKDKNTFGALSNQDHTDMESVMTRESQVEHVQTLK